MAFGYCHRLRLSVCVYVCMSVNHQFVWTKNLSPAQTTITKIGPEVPNILVKIPVTFGVIFYQILRLLFICVVLYTFS